MPLSRRPSKAAVGLDQVDNTSDATKNSASATLTNKTINLSSNTLSGTTAQFNTALSDGDFVTLAGTEALTNKTLTAPVLSGAITGTYSFGGTPTWPTFNQNTTGSAATLTTSRNFQTDLASTSAVGFNGSANNTHGVTGTLAVTNGGTGRATSTTAYGIIAAGTTATGAQQTISPGTSGQFLKSAGASSLASFASIVATDISDSSSVGRSVLTAVDAAAARTAIGAGTGTGDVTLNGSQTLTNKTIVLPALDSIYTGTPTNVNYSVSTNAGQMPAFSPVPKYVWHDLLRFNRWFGTPTYETYNGSWSTQTLDTSLFNGKEAQSSYLADGTTTTAVRWTWNSGNVSWSNITWWVIGFTYDAGGQANNVVIESSADGSAWTTRHTSSTSASSNPVWFYQDSHSGDPYIRLTVTSTSAKVIRISSIRALSTRWGNQGGGSEYEIPYDWDSDRNLTLGSTSARSDGVLNLGTTSTTAAAGGIYFGNDTNLYRSAANTLKTDDSLIVGTAGTVAGSAVTIDGTQTITNKTITAPVLSGAITGTYSFGGTPTWPTFNQNTTGSAATLTTSRNFQTDLASTSAVGFNGSANNTHGVTGILAVTNGGTGRNTATTAYGIIAAGTTATGAQQTISPGTSGQFLKSAGASSLASFAAITAADITGTTAQFNTALSDGDFATLAGNEVLTNKTVSGAINSSGATFSSGALSQSDRATLNFGTTPLVASTQFIDSGAQGSSFANLRYTATANGPYQILAKSRGATVGARAVVQQSDQLGSIAFDGDDGTDFIEGARIRAVVDGTPGTGDMPTRLEFLTTPDGANQATLAMTIKSNNAIVTAGDIELGHSSDTTLARGAAGRLTVEGVNVPTISSTDTLTNKTIDGANNTLTNIPIENLASTSNIMIGYNPDFASNITGWTVASGTWAYDGAVGRTANGSAKFTASGVQGEIASATIPVTAGKTYMLEVWVSGSGITNTVGDVDLWVEDYIGGALQGQWLLDGWTSGWPSYNNVPSSFGWRRLYGQFDVGTGIDGIRMVFNVDSTVSAGNIYFDDARIVALGIAQEMVAGTGNEIDDIWDGSGTVAEKTFNNTNTVTLLDTNFTLQDDADTTKTMKFNLSSIGTGTAVTLNVPNVTGSNTLLTLNSSGTVQNKRMVPRVTTVTSSATPTFSTDSCDMLDITALATNITSMTSSMTGTPNNGQKLLIRFKDNGSPRTIAWGSKFSSSGATTLLGTTVASKTHHCLFIWDAAASGGTGLWICIASDSTGY